MPSPSDRESSEEHTGAQTISGAQTITSAQLVPRCPGKAGGHLGLVQHPYDYGGIQSVVKDTVISTLKRTSF